jgi:hypothetical protein
MWRPCSLVVLLVSLYCFAAFAQTPTGAFVSGNRLHEWYEGGDVSKLRAMAYVLGAADTLTSVQAVQKRCVFIAPPDMTSGQVIDIVRLYLQKHPERRHYGADGIVYEALADAWPCSTRSE